MRINRLLTILFVLFYACAYCQIKNVDSLRKVITHGSHDTSRVGTYNILAYALYITTETTNDEFNACIDSAIKIANTFSYIKGKIKAKYIAGYSYYNTGKPNLAKKYLQEGLELSKASNDKDYTFRISNALGICYLAEGDYKLTGQYLFDALKIAEESQNTFSMARIYNSLGNLYTQQKNIEKAIHYHLKALKYNLQNKHKMFTSFSYVNLGNSYFILNNFDSAKYYYNKALVIQTSQKNKIGQAYSYHGIGTVYLKKGEFEVALDYFKRSFKLIAETEDSELYSGLLSSTGDVYFALKKYDLAQDYYSRAVEYNRSTKKLPVLSTSCLNLSKVFLAKKDFENAFKYYKQYSEIKDSINNTEIGKKISSLEYNYQIEQDKKIADLQNEKVRMQHEEEVKKQQIIIWSALIFLLVVSVLSLLIFRAYKQKAAINNLVLKQKQKVENQKKIIEVKQKEILDSINYAKRIQFALLAHANLLKSYNINYFNLFKPKDIVSGDFYWATQHQGKIYVAVCDCTGHGVPGAFMSVLNMGFLNEAIKEKNIIEPNLIFNYVRQRLIDNLAHDNQRDGMDGVLICIDEKNMRLTYSSANNQPLVIRDQKIIKLEKDKMPVGLGEIDIDFKLFEFNFQEGDLLYLFTDGIPDQFGGPEGKKFKHKKLIEVLLSLSHLDLNTQKEKLDETIEQWRGLLEQVDDICIMGIKL